MYLTAPDDLRAIYLEWQENCSDHRNNVKWGNFYFWGKRLIKGETLNHSNTWFAWQYVH